MLKQYVDQFGEGFLVNDNILNEFEVRILDDYVEGILWLSFVHKKDDFTFFLNHVYAI